MAICDATRSPCIRLERGPPLPPHPPSRSDVDTPAASHPQRRCESEEKRCECRDAHGEPNHRCVERDGRGAWHRVGVDGEERLHTEHGEDQPENPADSSQNNAFGQQLAKNAGTPGTKCGANGDLARAHIAAGEQEVRDVSAGDQQDEADRTHQDQNRAAGGPDDVRLHSIDARLEVTLDAEDAFRSELVDETHQIGTCALDCLSLGEPSDDVGPVTAALLELDRRVDVDEHREEDLRNRRRAVVDLGARSPRAARR